VEAKRGSTVWYKEMAKKLRKVNSEIFYERKMIALKLKYYTLPWFIRNAPIEKMSLTLYNEIHFDEMINTLEGNNE